MSSPPSTLGQYQIIREIARSNDIVYEAYDPLMNRRVAIKELSMPGGTTQQQRDERISRFKREAQAAGTLNHPNIMTVYSFAEDAGRTFMAMEYLDGATLRNEIDTHGTLSPERAVEIAVAILEGLSHAHSKGVIHRDIKPDNVQILSNGQIKITDFGIARLTFQPNLTMDGQVFGTPSYMSPEQVVGREIDARSDLFSVGVVLYEMLAGQKPFAGDSVVSITYAIMNTEPSQPAQIAWPLWQAIQRALEKAPGARYQSAEEMIQALQDALRPNSISNVQVYDPAATAGPTMPYAGTPYAGTPYAGAAPPVYGTYQQNQPGTYPFDPYAAQQAGYSQQPYVPNQGYGNQPYVPAGMAPPGPIPIYYPPPPRAPLLKPETVAFLKKLGVTVVIIGTLGILIVVGIGALTNAIENYHAEERDGMVPQTALHQDTRVPVEERIQNLIEYRNKLQSPSKIAEANHDLAGLYEELGNKYLAQNDSGSSANAEIYFQDAIQLDPHNAAVFSDLGRVYAEKARNESDPSQRADLWQQSAEQWQQAAEKETDGGKRQAYKEQTAWMFYYYASDVSATGELSARSDARNALREAAEDAPTGSEIEQRIQTMLTSLGG